MKKEIKANKAVCPFNVNPPKNNTAKICLWITNIDVPSDCSKRYPLDSQIEKQNENVPVKFISIVSTVVSLFLFLFFFFFSRKRRKNIFALQSEYHNWKRKIADEEITLTVNFNGYNLTVDIFVEHPTKAHNKEKARERVLHNVRYSSTKKVTLRNIGQRLTFPCDCEPFRRHSKF